MEENNTVSIVLADDHHIVRQGLRSLLETERDFQVVGEASGGLDAIKLVEALNPDILVLDMMMGDINGLEVTKAVAKSTPKTAVVILSMYDNEAYVLESLRSGAKAYVLKEATSDELVTAIREARAGHRYLSTSLSERAIETYVQKTRDTDTEEYNILTRREREVLQLTAQGFTNPEIAEKLFISRRTVEAHRSNLMKKLGLHNQTELIRYALQHGFISSD